MSDLELLLPSVYAALDEHRFADLALFYSEDVVATTPGGEVTGVPALVAQATRNHRGIAAIQHLVTNVLIETDDHDAALRANLVAVFAGDDGTPAFELGSVWRGRARREADAWLIHAFTITPVWRRGERPAV